MLVKKIDFTVNVVHKESKKVTPITSDELYEMLMKYNLRNVAILCARMKELREGKLVDGDGIGMSKLTFQKIK